MSKVATGRSARAIVPLRGGEWAPHRTGRKQRQRRIGRDQLSATQFGLAREFPESTVCVLLQRARIRGGSCRHSCPSTTGVKIHRERMSRRLQAEGPSRSDLGEHPRTPSCCSPPLSRPAVTECQCRQSRRLGSSPLRRVASSLSPPSSSPHTPSMSTSNAHLSSSASYPSASFRSRARSCASTPSRSSND